MKKLTTEELKKRKFRYLREFENTDFGIYELPNGAFSLRYNTEEYMIGAFEEINKFFCWMQEHCMDEDIISEIDALPADKTEKSVWLARYVRRRK